MTKFKRSTVIPLVLTAYLAVMASIGYPEYASGRMSALYYFGVIAITALIIILLHFNLKHRERLRQRHSHDNDKQNKQR